MKRFITTLLIALTFSVTARAQYTLTFNDVEMDGNTITAYTGNATNINIPESIGGTVVKTIGHDAFSEKSLTAVSIPASVTTIEMMAFKNNSLTSVTFETEGSQLFYIGIHAFFGNDDLSNISLPEINELGKYWRNSATNQPVTEITNKELPYAIVYSDAPDYPFNPNTKTIIDYFGSETDIAIPASINNISVEIIGVGAFFYKSLTSVTIPASVTNIEWNAFRWNHSIASVIFEPGSRLKNIGAMAFWSNSLKSVTIPASVTTIGEFAFKRNQLTSVNFETENSQLHYIGDEAFSENDGLEAIPLPINQDKYWVMNDGSYNNPLNQIENKSPAYMAIYTGNEGYVFDSETKTITDYNGSATQIAIPIILEGDTVKNIGEGAFQNKSLRYTVIPASIRSIAGYAFADNSNLQTIPLPIIRNRYWKRDSDDTPVSQITNDKASSYTVQAVKATDYVFNPETQTITDYIGDATAIDIPSTIDGVLVKTIGEDAFRRKSLISVTIPNSVTSIESGAFAFNSLTSIKIPASVTSIENAALSNNAITQVNFEPGSGLKEIGINTFYNNAITSLEIPASVTAIGPYALASNLLKSISIPASITDISEAAFRFNLLESVEFEPNSQLLSIYNDAFKDNPLDNIPLPPINNKYWRKNSETTPIDEIDDKTALYTAVSSNAPDYAFDSKTKTIIDYVGTSKTITIPSSIDGVAVEVIGESAFYENHLTSVTIPASVTTIAKEAFFWNELGNVMFETGSQLQTIGSDAFYGNELTSITIPGSVASIGEWAFSDNLLESITIPSSVKNISRKAFADNNLSSVTFSPGAQLTTIEVGVFTSNSLSSITIPSSITCIKEEAFADNSLSSVSFELGSQLKTIEKRTFTSNLLTSIIIPASVAEIGEAAFADNSLSSVSFEPGSQLKTIEKRTFTSNLLTSITIPASVAEIGEAAFANNSLSSVSFETENSQLYSIGNHAFLDNNSISSILLPEINNKYWRKNKEPEAVTEIIDKTAFYTAVNTDAPDYSFDTKTKTIIKYLGTNNTITIPSSINEVAVKSIGEFAFYRSSLASVTIPSSVQSIGKGAFSYNDFSSVTIEKQNSQLNYIGAYAFFSYTTPIPLPELTGKEWRINGGTRQVSQIEDKAAAYVALRYTYPITFSTTIDDQGKSNGSLKAFINDEEIISGDKAEYGSTIAFTATANTGYKVKQWLINGSPIDNITNLYTHGDLSADLSVAVEFQLKSYPVNFEVTSGNGSLTAEVDNNSITTADQIQHGKQLVFTATPETGYKIKQWLINGSPIDNTTNSYIHGDLSADLNVAVKFELESYKVAFTVSGGRGSLSAVVEGTDITPGDHVQHGKEVVFTATPRRGYKVKRWLVNGNSVNKTTNTYTHQELSADLTLGVVFELKTAPVTFSTSGENGSLTATVDGNNITSGNQVKYQKDIVFTATPDEGYKIKRWIVNGNALAGHISNTYTYENLSGSVRVNVEFELASYLLTFSPNTDDGSLAATVDGNNITSGEQVSHGKEVVFSATPNENYKVKRWIIDDEPLAENTSNTYTHNGVSSHLDVKVEFELLSYTVTFDIENANGGSLTASVDDTDITTGEQVQYGKEVVFSATPDDNYKVKQWFLNGNSLTDENTSNTYIHEQVSDHLNIKVEFELTTDIDDIASKKDRLRIYPNPTNSYVYVVSPDVANRIVIYSLTGEVVKQLTSNTQLSKVDLTGVTPGMYLVRVNNHTHKLCIK
ncbi:leucine-rich repeat protein [Sunxiuqinia elliptica]|uniref:Por secretion system C-terminal sorting domain-containing protein n=1 Tax=Sunxiuqinia elliptica TaxID=655355 RepID=A0A1I2KRA9_9BACT|nr:leucine-rich repeat protein [Sunxiuqinia elliptica]SFF69053.1 Por secretion system C-terminal sorting domain-containing protein [Sunxiuqinia elliptica]